MTMTDPIADMLTRVRNANVAMHDTVPMPSSKLKESLAAVLQREGYIDGFSVRDDPKRPGKILEIQMKYAADRSRTISGLKRVSKPGLRVYTRCQRCGRPKAVFRKFGLCRICLRELVHAGEVPGVTKASW